VEHLHQKAQDRQLSAETNTLSALAKLMELKKQFLDFNTLESNAAATRCQQNIDGLMKVNPSSAFAVDTVLSPTPRALYGDL
jgi:hypothetical protein